MRLKPTLFLWVHICIIASLEDRMGKSEIKKAQSCESLIVGENLKK